MPPGLACASKTTTLWPCAGEIEGGGEAARPGADDRHALAGFRHVRLLDEVEIALARHVVGDGALEPADGDGVALVQRRAGGLALVGADAPADLAERIGLVEELQAALEIALAHLLDVVGDRHVRRAGGDAEAALRRSGRPRWRASAWVKPATISAKLSMRVFRLEHPHRRPLDAREPAHVLAADSPSPRRPTASCRRRG